MQEDLPQEALCALRFAPLCQILFVCPHGPKKWAFFVATSAAQFINLSR